MGKTFSWLLYLRFDDEGEIVTMHVDARGHPYELLRMAEQRGFTPTQKLQEYAYFHVGGIVKQAVTPNFHYYSSEEFKERWQRGGLPASPAVSP